MRTPMAKKEKPKNNSCVICGEDCVKEVCSPRCAGALGAEKRVYPKKERKK